MSTSEPPSRESARETDHPLARAFRSFTEAAGSLERTYGQLHGQVAQLREELEVTNRNLTVSLNENRRMRERLHGILEGLPCGVLVIEGDEENAEAGREDAGRISVLNPEAARLTGGIFKTVSALPAALAVALEGARKTGRECELELCPPSANNKGQHTCGDAKAWVAIRHAWLEHRPENASSVYILRDVSAAKQLERDSENLRRQHALVEVPFSITCSNAVTSPTNSR